jgi:CBS domain-containing protein
VLRSVFAALHQPSARRIVRREPEPAGPRADRLPPVRPLHLVKEMSLARYKRPLATASADETVEQCARRMRDDGVGCLLVIRKGRPSGLVTDRDLVVRVLAQGIDPVTAHMGDFVTYDLITVSVNETIETATERMRVHGIRRLPVVDEQGEVVGIVTADDLLVLLGSELAAVCESIANRSDSIDSR